MVSPMYVPLKMAVTGTPNASTRTPPPASPAAFVGLQKLADDASWSLMIDPQKSSSGVPLMSRTKNQVAPGANLQSPTSVTVGPVATDVGVDDVDGAGLPVAPVRRTVLMIGTVHAKPA